MLTAYYSCGCDSSELFAGLKIVHIYNPKSVADALTWDEIQSYWTGTETYEALKVYIELNFDELKEAILTMLGNGRCVIDPSTFQNDMTVFRTRDDVLTLLVHLGYLTYDRETSEVFIPNQEIEQEFVRAVKVGGWDGVIQSLERSRKAYYVNTIMELPSGKGFADVVYLPRRNVDRPALIVELKWDKTADGAIRQMKEKEYASWIEGYTEDILLVGINYDKEEKVHECMIEKYVKTDWAAIKQGKEPYETWSGEGYRNDNSLYWMNRK